MTIAGALEYMTVDEAAKVARMSPVTYREHWRRGRVPGVRMPGTRRVLIPTDWLEARLGGAELVVRELADGGRLVEPRTRR
jgi:excisionase family DNA binding protein